VTNATTVLAPVHSDTFIMAANPKRRHPGNIALRAAVFLAGMGLLFFGWYRAHNATVDLTNPRANPGSPAEVLVVIGGFMALLAFLPSSQTLGRWMSLKRQKRPPPAHFRRRRKD
jgi:hypothetical protein